MIRPAAKAQAAAIILATLGIGLTGSVTALVTWFEKRWPKIETARQNYDKKNKSKKI
jgi:hypothetical protein